MSDEDYLQPGFDLSTITVPRLRSILVEHDVHYPSGAKKPELIDIVTSEILPKARKLLSARARTKRSSKGITDVPSSQEGTLNGDDDADEELMPPPPVPRTPRSRKSKSNIGLGNATTTPSTSRGSRTPGTRKSSSKHARASDTETDAEKPVPSARKSRKSQLDGPANRTPSVKIDEPAPRVKRESLEDGESPFTDDNPFQSGSSPIPDSRRVSSTSRNRKSLGATDRRKSSTRRRETTSPRIKQEDGFVAPSRSTFEFPVSSLSPEDSGYDALEASEEFTPEASRELARESAIHGALVRERPTALVRRKKKAPTSTMVKTAPWAILSIVGSAIGAWYRQEKVDIGYCGVGQPSWSLASNSHIPQWIHDNFQPQCEPCPPHAFCSPGMEVQCGDDFVLTPHPLALGGLVPLAPTCEPDSEKARKVKAVADRTVEVLREARATFECGDEAKMFLESTLDNNEEIKTVSKHGKEILEVPEETLKRIVSSKRRKGMTDQEFDDLWRPALGDILERDEIVVVRDGSGRIRLSSNSLARLPFNCAIRRSLSRTISQNRGTLAILISILAALGYGRRRITAYREAKAQIPGLVAMTLDRLATQASLKEDGRVGEGFLSIGQLRDDVLRNVFSASERERVWTGVRTIVEGNSNVRAAQREGGKTGEWSRVWEWIGPVNFAPGLEGRLSGGNLMPASGSGPASLGDELGNGTLEKGGRDVRDGRKWDEGRPIY